MSEQRAVTPGPDGPPSLVGASLTSGQVDQLAALEQELLRWNRWVNLTSITDPDDVHVKHVLDSLTVVPVLFRLGYERGTLVDVGSGAGFPGLVLAIAMPNLRVILVEASAKKTAFIRHVVESLALSNASTVAGRAEDLARTIDHRERYDVAIARAVGPVSTLVELLAPFLKVGGHLVFMKTVRMLDRELEAGQRALAALSCAVEQELRVQLPGLRDARALVVARKTAPTDSLYPRRAGIPSRRPL